MKLINPVGPFKVTEKDDDGTYELEDLGMKRLDLASGVLWVCCKHELVEGKVYKGRLSFHPSESLERGMMPEFFPK